MKNLIYLFLAIGIIACSNDNGASDIIQDDNGNDLTYVPDDYFEQELIRLGYDDILDDYIITENISSVIQLYISGYPGENGNIQDLTGIEDFTALQKLYCSFNRIATLDVSHNVNLEYLGLFSNNLSTLDVSQNLELKTIDCSKSQLTSLDVTQNLLLEVLYLNYNQLTELDVSHNNNLEDLQFASNQLTAINVTQNPKLKHLICLDNLLTTLNVSQNPLLNYLGCNDNHITSLDVSNNIVIEGIFCNNNLLTSLNVSNGNNQGILAMNAKDNPVLVCIEIDEGFSPYNCELPNRNFGWCKDSNAEYSINCN